MKLNIWWLVTLAMWSSAHASFREVTLNELVKDADAIVIAVGVKHATELKKRSGKDKELITVRIEKAIKGVSGQQSIVVCPRRNVESYDLSDPDGPERYILFAKRVKDCFEPLVGRRGVVEIHGLEAYTVGIYGQPMYVPLHDFLSRIELASRDTSETSAAAKPEKSKAPGSR